MGVRRTEAGRMLTDVDLGYKLAKPVVQTTNSTSAIHEETVPEGKFWILRHVHFNRNEAGAVDIQINAIGAGIKVVQYGAVTSGDYAPNTEYVLSAGWVVKVNFSSGTSGFMDSWVLYDEGEA